MIFINQRNDAIINFDGVLRIEKYVLKNSNTYRIICLDVLGNHTTLGEYDNEEQMNIAFNNISLDLEENAFTIRRMEDFI